MNLPAHSLGLLATGVASGILGSMLGVGGGVIIVPALIALAYGQKEAQAMSLAAMIPMALVSVYRYRVTGQANVPFMDAAILAVAAVIGALVGTHFVSQVSGELLRRIFGVFLVIIGVRLFWVR